MAHRSAQGLDSGPVHAPAAKPDDVQPCQARTVANYAAERHHVSLDARYAAYHRATADADELVDRGGATDYGSSADADVAAHDNVVRDHHAIAHVAIVRDVYDGHQQAVRADAGDPAAGDGAAVDGAVLAHLGPRADHALRRLAPVLEVLRRQADGAERVQHRFGADAGAPCHDDVRNQLGAGLDHHVRANMAPRPDLGTGHLGARLDDSGRMDAVHGRRGRRERDGADQHCY